MKAKGYVVIHVDAVRRDFSYCNILKAIFEENGFAVLLVSRRNLNLILKCLIPDVLVLSHVYTLSQDILHSLSETTDIYVMTVEAVGDESYQYKTDYPESIDYSCFKGIFLWNDKYKSWLIQNRNIATETVFAFGSPRLAMTKYVEKSKSNIVGLIGRFEFLNNFLNRPPLSALLTLTNENSHFRYRYFAETAGAVVYGELIRHLIAQGKVVSIRPHPNENPSAYDRVKDLYGDLIIIDDGIDFIEWILTVNVIVGTISTALTEAYVIGKPIISVDAIFDGQKYMVQYDRQMMPLTTIAYSPKTFNELLTLVSNEDLVPINSTEMDAFLKKHYNVSRGKSRGTNALVDLSKEIVSHRVPQNSWFSKNMVNSYYFVLDILTLMWNWKKQSRNIQKYYNFSRFLHKPSPILLDIQAKILKEWAEANQTK